jgi:hypothetical protein
MILLELIELPSINEVSLFKVSFCGNTGSIRDGAYCTSRENNVELTELRRKNVV